MLPKPKSSAEVIRVVSRLHFEGSSFRCFTLTHRGQDYYVADQHRVKLLFDNGSREGVFHKKMLDQTSVDVFIAAVQALCN